MRARLALSLIWRLLRVQVMNELQYRANFVMQVAQSVLALGLALFGLSLVFAHVTDLNGWSRPQLMALVGVFTLVGGFLRMFVRPNLTRLVDDVHDGTLDYVLTKPVDTLLLVSARAVQIWQGVDVLTGLAVVGWAVSELDGGVRIVDIAMFLVSLVLGVVIIYCFLFSLLSTSFWFVRVDEAVELFETVYQAGRWPLSIYPGWLRFGLTFVVPIAFCITLPAEAIVSKLSVPTLIGELIMAVALMAFTRWFFRLALRHYTGASA
jgi:ABC-2 type transport system permease protein